MLSRELRLLRGTSRQGAHVVFLLALLAASILPAALGATPVGASPDPPNDTTQARLRVSQCVYGVPEMDIHLSGGVPLDAGIPLSTLPGDVSRYEYLTPGAYSLAVVPVGQDMSQALLGPLDVTVAAGHRYTVVVLGQKDEASHKALVIDETAAYQAIGARPTDAGHITVNNIRGVPGIDFYFGGVLHQANVPYGGYKAALVPVGLFQGLKVTVAGAPDQLLDPGFTDEGYSAPAADALDCFGGTYPGTIGQDFDTHTSASTSLLNAVDYLQTLSDEAVKSGGKAPTNQTFLAALKIAELSDLLAHGGPYLVFAPTDEAFAALPKAQFNALMADPQALGALLRRHIVQGYYPPLTLVTGRFVGKFDRTVTNMLGEKLALLTNDQGTFINGENVGSFDGAMVANGTRVFPYLDKVLLAAPPAPGMPTTGAGLDPNHLPAGLPTSILVALALLLVGGLLRRRAVQH